VITTNGTCTFLIDNLKTRNIIRIVPNSMRKLQLTHIVNYS